MFKAGVLKLQRRRIQSSFCLCMVFGSWIAGALITSDDLLRGFATNYVCCEKLGEGALLPVHVRQW